MTLDLAREDERERLRWSRELLRCEDSVDYLAAQYLHIKSKHVIGFPKLILNPVQQVLRAAIADQLKRTGRVRQVWGKARQVGATTLGRALSFHNTGFKNNRNAFFAAHDEDTINELFEVNDKTFLLKLPEQLRPSVDANSKTRLSFSGRNSKVLVGHAKNLHVGAAQTNHIWHLTEVARYGENADTMQASLFPSFSDAKGEDHSIGIIESTSVYGGSWFKDFAEAAMEGENGYEFTFIPWHLHADYTAPVPKHFRLNEDERELKRKWGLTDGNLVWRRLKKAEYVSNPGLWMQDYPHSWEESWTLPKGTLRVFDDDLLGLLDQQLRPGRRFNAESSGLKESIGGLIEVWALPEDGVYYKIGADPSEGRTYDADWTVLEVVRVDTLEQVAEARFHLDPASEEFTSLVYWLGMAYNAAEVNPDITGGWGVALMSELQRRSYPNIWNWRRRDDARERVSNRLGFLFTKRDKAILVNTTVALVRRGGIIVHSQQLVEELRHYLNIGLDEWGAAPGFKDDCLREGALVKTSTGYRPIEQLRVGDEVMTHMGRYRPVTQVIRKPFSGPFYRLKPYNQIPLDVSHNHPVLATRRDTNRGPRGYRRREWLLPGQWRKSTHRVLSIIEQLEDGSTVTVRAEDYYQRDPRASNVGLTTLALDGQFAHFLGRFLADGCCIGRRAKYRRQYAMSLAFHENDRLGILAFRAYLQTLGVAARLERNRGKGVALVFASKLLWTLLEQCYDGRREKIIPPYAYQMGHRLRFVLEEWLAGDGHDQHGRRVGATTSRALALGMRDIAWSLGKFATISCHRRHRYGKPCKDQFWVHIEDKHPRTARSRQISECEYSSVMRTVETEQYVGDVFNLEVADDESFVANGIVVHNCASGWFLALLAARDERIDLPEPSDEDQALKQTVKTIAQQVRHDVDHDLREEDDRETMLALSPWRVQ